jgi:hypothetical protein
MKRVHEIARFVYTSDDLYWRIKALMLTGRSLPNSSTLFDSSFNLGFSLTPIR